MRDDKLARVIREISGFFTFFAVVAVVVTLSVTVFLGVMAESAEIEYTRENISDAAKATMLCTVVITVAFYAVDRIRRYYTVEKPAQRIIDASDRIMRGDFSYRIATGRQFEPKNEFDLIADRINEMAKALSSTETLRVDFVSNVSHEIKTPLAVMKNYAALLRSGNVTEAEREEYTRAIEDAATRLSTLVTNILRLNKLENQQLSPRLEKYDLAEQVCTCLLQFEEVWEKKNITVSVDSDDEVWVLGDSDMMELVWSNLISNALKFTHEGGEVAVSVHAVGEYAVFGVRDTGEGMSKETGAHIFDKFYQGDTSHSRGGNGLGLALVKRVIDITGSSVSVESELGVGSTFTVKMRRNL